MKKLTVGKIAAIAAGAVLVGASIAPLVAGISSSDAKTAIYDASGSPVVNVVVGSSAAVSDAVWAGNIAAKIVEKAVTTGTGTGGSSDGSLGTAQVTDLAAKLVLGGTVTYDNAKTFDTNTLDSFSGTAHFEYHDKQNSKSQLSNLTDQSQTFKYGGSSYSINIKEYVNMDADAKFDTTATVKDLVAYFSTGDINYVVDFGTGIPYREAPSSSTDYTDGSNDDIRVPIFGKNYLYQASSSGGDSSVDNATFIEDKAKQTFLPGESFEVTGVGSEAGKKLTVTVTQVVASGPAASSYTATFQVTDEAGTVVDIQNATAGNFVDFVDSSGSAIAGESTIYLDFVGVQAGTNEGYVQLLVGTDSLKLYDGKGWPYDSSKTSGWDWQVTIDENTASTSVGNSITRVIFSNVVGDRVYKSIFDSTYPLYSTDDSLSAAASAGAKEAVFLGGTGVAGEDYFSIVFDGFKEDQSTTQIKIGNDQLVFKDFAGTQHTIPFVIGGENGLSAATGTTGGSTFTFDGRTIYYLVNQTDVNVPVIATTLLNGIAQDVNTLNSNNCSITSDFGGANDVNNGVGASVTINGISYAPQGCNGGFTTLWLKADGNVQFSLSSISSSTAAADFLPDELGGNSLDNNGARNTFFYDDANTSADLGRTGVRFPLFGDSYFVSYDPFVSESQNKMWLVLDSNVGTNAQAARIPQNSSGSGQTIEYGKDIRFMGTDTDENFGAWNPTGSTRYTGIARSGEGAKTYYWPDISAVGENANDNTFFTAIFTVDANEANISYPWNVYIDTTSGNLVTLPNANRSAPTSDVNFYSENSAVDQNFNLDLAGNSSSLTKGYSDFGTLADIATDPTTAIFTIPQDQPKISFTVKTAGTTTTTTGGETLTINKGETGTSSTGTKITVDDITYTATVVGNTGSSSTVAVTPGTYVTPASLNGKAKVYTTANAPAGKKIVVGGPMVNSFATAIADKLTKSGDWVSEVLSNGDVVVAGYTAGDTGTAAQDLIDALDSA